MFCKLVESGSHGEDFKRKGSFFIFTLVFYSLILVAAGVGSIYAYEARLSDPVDEEFVTLLKFTPARTERAETPRPAKTVERPAQAAREGEPAIAMVREVAHISPHLQDRPTASADAPVLAPDMPYVVGPENIIPTLPPGLPGGKGGDGSPNDGRNRNANARPIVVETEEPPPLKQTPTPAPRIDKPVQLSSEIIAGKAAHKPAPPYPNLAKQLGIEGTVAVQIVIDEEGRVISARPTSGHPLLQDAAVKAAYRARFTPTRLNGQAVKVSGVITYNFLLR